MSRKHFVAVAKVIAAITDKTERRRTAEELATVFAGLNSEFRRSTFLDACGVE